MSKEDKKKKQKKQPTGRLLADVLKKSKDDTKKR